MGFSSRIFSLRDGIDIYLRSLEKDISQITFYKINSREEIKINAGPDVSILLSEFDGIKTLSKCMEALREEPDENDVKELVEFLETLGVIKEERPGRGNRFSHDRFNRQINFFDNWIPGRTGEDCQNDIISKKVAIIGVGSVGGGVAIELVRAGVKSLTLVDPKVLTPSGISRHPYFKEKYIGKSKVSALSDYLSEIDPDVTVECYPDSVFPETDLSSYLKGVDLVVNTADEPYIGYTSIKIGRYAWSKGVPMYVAGGFDAHLMSTGDFIVPGVTPCVDCCASTFSVALKDWKPKYATAKVSEEVTMSSEKEVNIVPGLASRSLFASSYAAMEIINYLAGGEGWKISLSQRGEFLPNSGCFTRFALEKQKGCEICYAE